MCPNILKNLKLFFKHIADYILFYIFATLNVLLIIILIMRKINKIIIHCTATDRYASIESIKRSHLLRGFSDIGYHFLIDRYGFIHVGRPLSQVGAHCKGQNVGSIGIALIGGKNGKFDFSFNQLTALYDLVLKLKKSYPEIENSVYGHNNFTNKKTCPNFNVLNFFGYEGI